MVDAMLWLRVDYFAEVPSNSGGKSPILWSRSRRLNPDPDAAAEQLEMMGQTGAYPPSSAPPPLSVNVPFVTTISRGRSPDGKKLRAFPSVLLSTSAAASSTD